MKINPDKVVILWKDPFHFTDSQIIPILCNSCGSVAFRLKYDNWDNPRHWALVSASDNLLAYGTIKKTHRVRWLTQPTDASIDVAKYESDIIKAYEMQCDCGVAYFQSVGVPIVVQTVGIVMLYAEVIEE